MPEQSKESVDMKGTVNNAIDDVKRQHQPTVHTLETG